MGIIRNIAGDVVILALESGRHFEGVIAPAGVRVKTGPARADVTAIEEHVNRCVDIFFQGVVVLNRVGTQKMRPVYIRRQHNETTCCEASGMTLNQIIQPASSVHKQNSGIFFLIRWP